MILYKEKVVVENVGGVDKNVIYQVPISQYQGEVISSLAVLAFLNNEWVEVKPKPQVQEALGVV